MQVRVRKKGRDVWGFTKVNWFYSSRQFKRMGARLSHMPFPLRPFLQLRRLGDTNLYLCMYVLVVVLKSRQAHVDPTFLSTSSVPSL